MYTIGQVSEMFGLPISTLRYYDKEGLFPNIERTGKSWANFCTFRLIKINQNKSIIYKIH